MQFNRLNCLLITARIRRMGKVMFSVCLPPSGGYLSQVSSPFLRLWSEVLSGGGGGYPSLWSHVPSGGRFPVLAQVLPRGYPPARTGIHPLASTGIPPQAKTEVPPPARTGVPPPPPGNWLCFGTPHEVSRGAFLFGIMHFDLNLPGSIFDQNAFYSTTHFIEYLVRSRS